MDENKQRPKADYQPSIEAGLRRLESEKLSFLGSGNLVSKFDPDDLEAYAHLDDDEEEEVGESTTTYDRTLPEMVPESFSNAMTLDKFSGSESLDSLSDEDMDAGEETKQHELLKHSGVLRSLKSDDLPGGLDNDEDDEDDATMTSTRQSLADLGVIPDKNEVDFWPSRPAATLEFAALRTYESQEGVSAAKKTSDSVAASISNLLDDGEIQDLSSQQFMMVASGSMEVVQNNDNVPSAEGMRRTEAQAAEQLPENNPMNQLQSEMERMERVQTHDFGREANEIFLETAATTDLGSVAERVREALEAQNLNTKPTSRVIRQGSVKLQRPQPAEPVSAMDRLKEQGIFEHLGAHAEVSNNILDIQELSAILPESKLTSYPEIIGDGDDDDDFEDRTCEQEPEGVEEVRQMVMRAKAAKEAKAQKIKNSGDGDNLTIPLRQPDVVPTLHAEEKDLDDRMTIPISIHDHPEFAEILNAQPVDNAAMKNRHRSPVQESLHTPTMMVTETESRASTVLIWVVVVVILIGGGVAILHLTGLNEKLPFLQKADPVLQGNVEPMKAPPTQEEIGSAIVGAVLTVHQAAEFENWMEPWLETRINHQASPESRLPYLELAYEMFAENPAHRKRLIEDYIAAGQFKNAQKIVLESPTEVQAQAAIKDLYYQSFSKDPHFIGPPVTLDETMCDMVSPLGGGSTVTFKMLKDDKPIGAFKPYQTRLQSNYRSEIAAWRLCELLSCDFDVPWNRPVRIEYNLFHKLYNRAPAQKRDKYRPNLADMISTKEENSRFFYGTLKDWVPDFTRFPIELISMWRPWLSMDNFIEEFEPLEDALSSLKRRGNTQILYPELLKQSPGLTTKQLVAQVSEVLTFDFLIGNWDRFSGVPEWWGVNCQFKDGRIISIDNGASFPTYSNDKVYERFMMVERFNPRFIQTLRNLDKTKTFELLFPGASEQETKRFEQFWKQREAVLKRVDDLCLKYGTEKVLSL